MFDTAIVGGGLAGSLAAITLAQRGHRVVLLEAGRYPRPKVCGEFLSPETQALFHAAGVMPVINGYKPESINIARITAPNGTAWETTFPEPAIGLSRYALDHLLVEQAAQLGVATHTNTRITDIQGDTQQGFVLEARAGQSDQSFNAKTVIVAHGKHSTLNKILQQATSKTPAYIGLKRHFTGIPISNRVDLHVFRGGYCGMSHVENGATNVCLLVRQDIFKNVMQHKNTDTKPSVDVFIDWMVQQNPYLTEWFSMATPIYDNWVSISGVSLDTKKTVAGDILLAGDAAGMIAPLAGDGMAMALHSGQMAATATDSYLRGESSAVQMKYTYSTTWRHTFANRLRLGRALNRIMLSPPLLTPSLRLLNFIPRLGDELVRQTRDLSLMERSTT